MKNNSADNPAAQQQITAHLTRIGCATLDDVADSFDESTLEQPEYEQKFQAARDAFNAWADGGGEIPDDLLPFITWKARRFRLGVLYGEIPNPNQWLSSSIDFLKAELPPRASYLVDKETGATVFYESSLNQLFAFRGLGKSVVGNALSRVFLDGGEWLRFRSTGQRRVLLVDAELPKVQLQERLKEFTGASERFKIISPELMNAKRFPNLSQPKDQKAFLEQIEDFEPNVIIFDTLTRCFRFDTNDPDAWLRVNDFLIDLRSRGYCVILIHHGGKNGTQRGRTDGDDNLDVSVMLEKPYAWQPGDGLAFKWSYVKVRHGGSLLDFSASYDLAGWHVTEDERVDRIREMLAEGKSERAIARELDINQSTVNRIKRRVGLERLNGGDA